MPELRTRAKLVRFTAAEWLDLEQRAHAATRRPAEYLREAALTGAPPAPDSARPNAELLHTLTRIGADIQTLVHNSDAADRALLHRAMDELVATLRHLTGREPGA
jgi:hypothetical protein